MRQISDKVSYAEFILQEFEKMWKYWEDRREKIAIEQIAALHQKEKDDEEEELKEKRRKAKEASKAKSK